MINIYLLITDMCLVKSDNCMPFSTQTLDARKYVHWTDVDGHRNKNVFVLPSKGACLQ